MKSELIVDVRPNEVSIALLEDSRLVSLQKEARNIAYAVGDIYLAKVKKLMPGLNAAFVNVGYEKDAFLHYLDLGPRFASYDQFLAAALDDTRTQPNLSRNKLLPDIDKHGTITDQLQPGKQLLVQIVKEPISSKGPRLTTELTFTGRYMVLIPFCDKISISQKIKSTEEKARLRQLISSIKPKNFGVIVRTSAEGKKVAELNNELETLLNCWKSTIAKAQKATPPALVFEEESRIVNMLRDVFSASFEAIHVNDPEVYEQILNCVSIIAPDKKDIVKLYNKEMPIFDHFAVTRQIKTSFGKTVSFKSGAYLIIEHTEALHVIDVNSGNRTKNSNDQESNALEVNLRAAEEIARQLRLRDMGGIIVIDFIDMAKNEHRQQLFEHMRELMSNDRARHNILPLSKFGLMQITRQRVRPVLDIAVTETCPSCFGKGEVQPSLLFTDTLKEKIEYLVDHLEIKNFVMYVHPFVDAYIKKGLFTSIYGKWRRSLGRCFKIVPDESLAYLQYRVIDSKGDELDLREEKDTNSATATKTKDRLNLRVIGDAESSGANEDDKSKETPKQPKKKAKNKPEKPEKPDKPDKSDKSEKPEKPEKPEKAQKPAKPKKPKAKSEHESESIAEIKPEKTPGRTSEQPEAKTESLPESEPDSQAAENLSEKPALPAAVRKRRHRKPAPKVNIDLRPSSEQDAPAKESIKESIKESTPES